VNLASVNNEIHATENLRILGYNVEILEF